ncbi:hypothetical protein [Bacteroides caecimuris]|uniref:hypothetical protein n=1 Tax=Bacteroides caecimuris TaxID=1796613 RepID=UPI001ABF2801|nr:hypothetical protein [Bacteroides caecimuris]
MARYDLSKIMRRAHQLFTNARAKYPTFADALRKSWSMAKFEVRVAEERQAIEAENQEYMNSNDLSLWAKCEFITVINK